MKSEPKQKRILFLGGNFYPEPTGIGKYNGEMIDLFAQQGYECTVITTFPYYPYWKIQEPYARSSYWYKRELRQLPETGCHPVEIFRCPHYVPVNPTAKKRIIHDVTFLFFSFIKVLQLLFRKPYDFVIVVVPSFQIGLLGLLYKKLRKAKFIYHIQDLQIDAAQKLDMIHSKILINLLFKIERFILRHADVVSTISAGMAKKISRKVKRKVVFFPNWVDTKSFFPIVEQGRLKEEFDISPFDKVVLYSGSIGEKQGLENLLEVANTLKFIRNIKFVICGSGPYTKRLKEIAKRNGLDNVLFLPLQPADKLNSLLNMADIHLVLQKANACDLVMPSKLTTILSVGGLAIVAANPDSSLYETVSNRKLGILIPPENKSSLKEAIEYALKSNFESFRVNARKYAEESLAVEQVFSRYVRHIL